jgi:hypothetical protein
LGFLLTMEERRLGPRRLASAWAAYGTGIEDDALYEKGRNSEIRDDFDPKGGKTPHIAEIGNNSYLSFSRRQRLCSVLQP